LRRAAFVLNVRLRQQRLLVFHLRPLDNQRAAMTVGRGDKSRGHVVAERRNLRDAEAVDDRQLAAVVVLRNMIAGRAAGARTAAPGSVVAARGSLV
jgi:hypothetical protein